MQRYVSRAERAILWLVTQILYPFIQDGPKRMLYLGLLQRHGMSAIPVRYWEPIPLVDDLDRITKQPHLLLDPSRFARRDDISIDLNARLADRTQLDQFFRFIQPIRDNPMFPLLDCFAYWHICNRVRPKRIIEIGAGYSTFIAIHSTSATVTCIEPYPSTFLNKLLQSQPRATLIQKPVQEVSLSAFAGLEPNDILFIDSTHVLFPGSDLVQIFLHILPQIKPGVLIHFHDVSFPYESPRSLLFDSGRMYNELYLVAALFANCPDLCLLFSSQQYLLEKKSKESAFPDFGYGISIWMTKVAPAIASQ